jgi:hypothetical protein
MDTDAPNFGERSNYPLGGERIGPAWRMVWRRLDAKRWISGHSLAVIVCAFVDVKPETVRGLLWKAEKVGILEKRLVSGRLHGGERKLAEYRVAKKNLSA